MLLSLVERAERGEYDALIVARFDRLSRDYATLIVLERRLQRNGVRLLSAAEENGDGPIAEFMRGQLALVAQLERAMILDRVGAGKARKKALGRRSRPHPVRLPLDGRPAVPDDGEAGSSAGSSPRTGRDGRRDGSPAT